MAIVGFNFTKINAELNEKTARESKININNNISIKSVELAESVVASKGQKLLRFEFEFKSNYSPNLGSIALEGNILVLEEAKKVDDIEKEWKKSKTLPPETMKTVLSTALNKCNIQALILSQYLNLPAPIPLPKVEVNDKK